MKLQNLLTNLFFLLIIVAATAQTNTINYKALIKDNLGNVVASQSVTVQFQILQGAGMANVYQETHTTNTDANGLVILNIGNGAVNSGVYANIDWGSDDHFLNVQINTGSGLTDMGTTAFTAVPYALSAQGVASETIAIDELGDAKYDGASLFVGEEAGFNDDGTNNYNVGVGYRTIYSNISGIQNTGVGRAALFSNTTGNNNVAIGDNTLFSNISGSGNIATGLLALYNNTLGSINTAIGESALRNNTGGDTNIALGSRSLFSNIDGNRNFAAGRNSGYSNTTGDGNIFLGHESGYNETGSNKLYIENSDADADSALVYGEFDTNMLRTNGTLQIGNPANTGFAFPTADGTANQILQTNGSGALTWQDAAASGATELNQLTDAKTDDFSVFIGNGSGFNDDGGNFNVAIGINAMFFNTSGSTNTAIGESALNKNTTGVGNTAIGQGSLASQISGFTNTAVGRSAGFSNTTGNGNIFLGHESGYNETGSNKLYIENSDADADSALVYGEFNTNMLRTNGTLQIGNPANTGFAFPTADGTANQILQTNGSGALTWQDAAASGATSIDELTDAKYDGNSIFIGANSGGNNDGANNQNVGVGAFSLENNTTGFNNVAIGYRSLFNNTTGFRNNAIGGSTLTNNTTGNDNIAFGSAALFNNTQGNNNTAIGKDALLTNTLGSDNISLGNSALRFNTEGSNNVATGQNALRSNTTGNQNTAIGERALFGNTVGSNNTALGYNAAVPDGTLSNQVRIGNESVSYAGVQVAWDITSDKRWKDNIRELPYGLNMVSQLQPVDYIRKNNETKTREIGFIAQDVEQLLKDLDYTDQGLLHKDAKGYMSLRYNDFIPVLVKAIQEQQLQIEVLKSRNEHLEHETAEIEVLKTEMNQIKVMLGIANKNKSDTNE